MLPSVTPDSGSDTVAVTAVGSESDWCRIASARRFGVEAQAHRLGGEVGVGVAGGVAAPEPEHPLASARHGDGRPGDAFAGHVAVGLTAAVAGGRGCRWRR